MGTTTLTLTLRSPTVTLGEAIVYEDEGTAQIQAKIGGQDVTLVLEIGYARFKPIITRLNREQERDLEDLAIAVDMIIRAILETRQFTAQLTDTIAAELMELHIPDEQKKEKCGSLLKKLLALTETHMNNRIALEQRARTLAPMLLRIQR